MEKTSKKLDYNPRVYVWGKRVYIVFLVLTTAFLIHQIPIQTLFQVHSRSILTFPEKIREHWPDRRVLLRRGNHPQGQRPDRRSAEQNQSSSDFRDLLSRARPFLNTSLRSRRWQSAIMGCSWTRTSSSGTTWGRRTP